MRDGHAKRPGATYAHLLARPGTVGRTWGRYWSLERE